MKLTDKYSVSWEYSKIKLLNFSPPKETISTTCYLFDEELNLGTVGKVQWYTKDPFSKEVARKRSLTKAINRMAINKEARRSIWQGYLSRKFSPYFTKRLISKMKDQKTTLVQI